MLDKGVLRLAVETHRCVLGVLGVDFSSESGTLLLGCLRWEFILGLCVGLSFGLDLLGGGLVRGLFGREAEQGLDFAEHLNCSKEYIRTDV